MPYYLLLPPGSYGATRSRRQWLPLSFWNGTGETRPKSSVEGLSCYSVQERATMLCQRLAIASLSGQVGGIVACSLLLFRP